MRHRRLLILAVLPLLGACAHIGAQPWQRDVLARKSMQLAREPAIMAFDEHTYFSKEAASGGRSFDGGGCGCN
jgi:signal transduction histidine kinase